VYGQDKPENKLLANCYRNVLQLAEEHEIDSLAFPAISTGAFGYPMKDAAGIAFTIIEKSIPDLDSVKEIRFVLFSNRDLKVHQQTMEEVFS
jgi:O-acetyl-ADP-ribose deacetylase (regulator of RNase III)